MYSACTWIFVKESFLVFSVEALFQIFDLVKGLMHPNSKIFDFVNLTAEIVDYPLLFLTSDILDFLSFLCLFVSCYSVFKVLLQIALYSFQTFRFVVENKGIEPLTPCVQGRCSPS